MTMLDAQPDRVLAELAARWRTHLTAEDIGVIEAAGYGRTEEPGTRPALVLVDFQRAYVGDDKPILDQLVRWPSAGGAAAWTALRSTLPVLEAARSAKIPIVFTRIAYDQAETERNGFARKRGGGEAFVEDRPGTRLEPLFDRREEEPVLSKTAASAFFGTDLDAILEGADVDTVMVCGLSTSGCVRATVVDAAARGYRTLTLAECSADRISASHDIALFDIWLKYGSVVSNAATLQYLAGLPSRASTP